MQKEIRHLSLIEGAFALLTDDEKSRRRNRYNRRRANAKKARRQGIGK